MIHTNRVVIVGEQESSINGPIILYRGDGEVEVEFTISGHKFMFTNGGNVIKSTNATHGQLVINTPSGKNIPSEVSKCQDGKIMFIITKEMIDEIEEIGLYDFQVRLFDSEELISRVTIPPVYNGIDIREPIATEEMSGITDIGSVDYAIVKKSIETLDTFLSDGNYNRTNWEKHDTISEAKLNKIEDALYTIVSMLLKLM